VAQPLGLRSELDCSHLVNQLLPIVEVKKETNQLGSPILIVHAPPFLGEFDREEWLCFMR